MLRIRTMRMIGLRSNRSPIFAAGHRIEHLEADRIGARMILGPLDRAAAATRAMSSRMRTASGCRVNFGMVEPTVSTADRRAVRAKRGIALERAGDDVDRQGRAEAVAHHDDFIVAAPRAASTSYWANRLSRASTSGLRPCR